MATDSFSTRLSSLPLRDTIPQVSPGFFPPTPSRRRRRQIILGLRGLSFLRLIQPISIHPRQRLPH
jgi:hypothetical protein